MEEITFYIIFIRATVAHRRTKHLYKHISLCQMYEALHIVVRDIFMLRIAEGKREALFQKEL